MTEHGEQCALFDWANQSLGRFPELKYMFAIPNGAKAAYKRMPNGRTFSPEGQWLKQEGRKKGVPDIMLPVPRQGFHGLFIEMKFNKNKVSPDQRDFIDFLVQQEYSVAVCYTTEFAIQVITDYLERAGWTSKGILLPWREKP